jgi:hypothetical protein
VFTTDVKTKKRLSAVKITALSLCVVFAALSFLSAVYILTNANHTHDHDGLNGECAACGCLTSAVNLLNQIFIGTPSTRIAVFGLFLFFLLLHPTVFYLKFPTPIALKVRMNN